MREDPLDEGPQRVAAPYDSLLGAEQVAHQRALQGGVGMIKRHRGVQVLGAQRLIPRLEDVLDLGGRVTVLTRGRVTVLTHGCSSFSLFMLTVRP